MEENSGLNKTRNRILDVIMCRDKAGYVILLDDDDYLTPTALSDIAGFLKENSKQQWMVTGCETPEGKPVTRFNQTGTACYLAREKNKRKAVENDACHAMHTDLIGFIRFPEQFKNDEQWYFFLLLAKISNMFLVDKTTKIVEYQSEGLSVSNKKKKDQPLAVQRLKVEAYSGFVSEGRLNQERLLLARELIRSKCWSEASAILTNIDWRGRLSLRFLRYRLKVLFHA
jgi:hypothetical protein